MDAHGPPQSFGSALKAALAGAKRNQAELARHLTQDPGQVSRWATDKAIPHADTVRKIEEWLGVDLSQAFARSTPAFELYVSAPITGLPSGKIAAHRDSVEGVVAAARPSVNGVYWPGESVRTEMDLVAPDIATERNLKVLSGCSSFLYLQFEEVVQPSGALIELGLAMGLRCKTTIIVRRGLKWPYMLAGLPGVVAGLNFLPKARLYEVDDAAAAAALVARNGRELLGLS